MSLPLQQIGSPLTGLKAKIDDIKIWDTPRPPNSVNTKTSRTSSSGGGGGSPVVPPDNNTAAITVSETAFTIAENAGTDTYTVVLNTQPANNVTITVTADNTAVTVTSDTVTFT
ncbi:MAG: hypothetical protein F4138_05350, partial [Acidimicrobiia bacterium]|nr:hypothetical protein [Acidimicrobiia bacterium]